jgi:hypothetical protein
MFPKTSAFGHLMGHENLSKLDYQKSSNFEISFQCEISEINVKGVLKPKEFGLF